MDKINREIQRQVMDIIQKDVDDPIAVFLSITKVETTSDLQDSKIYFSLLNESEYDKAQQLLSKMRGFIRSALGKKIRLKILPQLIFIPDDSIKYSVDIYKKIEEIKNSEKKDRT
jgi:ribosome-binding factor A